MDVFYCMLTVVPDPKLVVVPDPIVTLFYANKNKSLIYSIICIVGALGDIWLTVPLPITVLPTEDPPTT